MIIPWCLFSPQCWWCWRSWSAGLKNMSLFPSWWVYFPHLHSSHCHYLKWGNMMIRCDPLCVFFCLFWIGSLVVCLVGLPGEASAAWSPLLHPTTGQEICSAPQHTGTIHTVPLSSCFTATLCSAKCRVSALILRSDVLSLPSLL